MTYEQYAPGLRYGYDLVYDDAYRNKRWSDVRSSTRHDSGNSNYRHCLGQGQGCGPIFLGKGERPTLRRSR